MKRTFLCWTVLLAVLSAAPAAAQFSWFSYCATDTLPGFVVNDLYVDFAGEVPIVEMLLDLPGQIYQDPFGDAAGGPPNVNLLPLIETIRYDTFVTLGSETSPIPGTALLIAGGAVDIGGQPGSTMSEDLIDITWSPAGGQTFPNTNPGQGMLMARVTLAAGSSASITVLLQDANGSSGAVEFPFFFEPTECIPEPATGMLLLGAALMILTRYRVGRS